MSFIPHSEKTQKTTEYCVQEALWESEEILTSFVQTAKIKVERWQNILTQTTL